MATTSSSVMSKPKRAKVLTHRPKLYSLEKTVAESAVEKIETASEIIPL
jgi:hypothetical protein